MDSPRFSSKHHLQFIANNSKHFFFVCAPIHAGADSYCKRSLGISITKTETANDRLLHPCRLLHLSSPSMKMLKAITRFKNDMDYLLSTKESVTQRSLKSLEVCPQLTSLDPGDSIVFDKALSHIIPTLESLKYQLLSSET